uniref:Ion_trans_2 domain-containing protein n=1 Tax=Syphacia muris TaxID=451379 RepID=A0A0N5AB80_9BILA
MKDDKKRQPKKTITESKSENECPSTVHSVTQSKKQAISTIYLRHMFYNNFQTIIILIKLVTYYITLIITFTLGISDTPEGERSIHFFSWIIATGNQ